jgi:TRAP-type uncharacterized transport system substrate-binding protein
MDAPVGREPAADRGGHDDARMNIHSRPPAGRPAAAQKHHLTLMERMGRMLQHTVLIAVGVVLAIAGIIALTLYIQSRPVTLKVAVGPRSSEDMRVMQAFAQFLSRERASVRLSITRLEGPAESAAAIDQNKADLAVVRRDLAMPKNGQVIAIQRRNVVVLAVPSVEKAAPKARAKGNGKTGNGKAGNGKAQPAPKQPQAAKPIEKIEDLAGRTVAIVGRSSANVGVLDTILAQYGVPSESVTKLQFGTDDLTAQLRAAKFDALLIAGPLGSKLTVEAITAITHGSEQPKFLEIGSSEAIEKQNPAFESTEIAAGAFGGSRPAEAIETIGFSHFIVARRTLDDKIAGDVTRLLFGAKQSLSTEWPAFSRVESPDTDKAATLAVHPGALAYLEGEQKTFFERYSEPMYWGLMLLSFVGSGAAWLMSYSRSTDSEKDSNDLEEALATVRRARLADSGEELDLLRLEVDEIVERMIRRLEGSEIDQGRASALTLAAEQARNAIAERRLTLKR